MPGHIDTLIPEIGGLPAMTSRPIEQPDRPGRHGAGRVGHRLSVLPQART